MKISIKAWILPLTLSLGFYSCSKVAEKPYPNMLTEMVVAEGSNEGTVKSFLTDGGVRYMVTNTMKGLEPGEYLRGMAMYVAQESMPLQATLYSLQAAVILHDCSDSIRVQHPTAVQSVWSGGGYINLHLYPKSEGHRGYWGFLRDSIKNNVLCGKTHYLSLYHNQGTDEMAYSSHLYASLPIDSVKEQECDSIVLSIHTFDNVKAWRFTCRTE